MSLRWRKVDGAQSSTQCLCRPGMPVNVIQQFVGVYITAHPNSHGPDVRNQAVWSPFVVGHRYLSLRTVSLVEFNRPEVVWRSMLSVSHAFEVVPVRLRQRLKAVPSCLVILEVQVLGLAFRKRAQRFTTFSFFTRNHTTTKNQVESYTIHPKTLNHNEINRFRRLH